MFINVQLMEIDVFLKTSAKRDVKNSDVFCDNSRSLHYFFPQSFLNSLRAFSICLRKRSEVWSLAYATEA